MERFTKAKLLFAALAENAQQQPAATALLVKREGRFTSVPWAELNREVQRLAAAFLSQGLQPGDRIALVSENRYEWIVIDLAILAFGGVHVPIHVSLSGSQIVYQVVHSGASLLIVSGESILDAIEAAEEKIPASVSCYALDLVDRRQTSHHLWRPYQQLLDCAEEASSREKIREIQSRIGWDDLATIMYTSGTTGEPKGVMLSHGNLASNALGTSQAFETAEDQLRLCFLPMSHIFGRTCDVYTWLYQGTKLALAECRETIVADAQTTHPTVINGVPYFFEKLMRHLQGKQVAEQPGVLRNLLGGKIVSCFSGGAPLPDHVVEYYESQDVPLMQGYGLSETSPVITASSRENNRRGKVGKPIAGVEVRIAEDGEIVTRGPHVMLGYWKNEQASREVLVDQWLHTGDLGEIDEEGFLQITGRKKEMIVTAAGKNIAPAQIETLLLTSPYILQAIVVGEGQKYLGALIVPEPDQLRAAIRKNRWLVFSRRGALRHRKVQKLYRTEIDRLLSGLSHHEQIAKFVLLDRGFTPETGELTPKASMKRDVIAQNFSAELKSLYAEQ